MTKMSLGTGQTLRTSPDSDSTAWGKLNLSGLQFPHLSNAKLCKSDLVQSVSVVPLPCLEHEKFPKSE